MRAVLARLRTEFLRAPNKLGLSPFALTFKWFSNSGRHFFLQLAMAPLLLSGLAAWSVALIDPYDLRPWGANVRLKENIDPQYISQRLIDHVAKGGYTHVLIGGSTVMRVTPEMIHRIYGSNARAFNISFPGIRPADLMTILGRLKISKSLERIIIAIDATMLARDGHHRQGFPVRYYDPKWHDFARDFDWTSVSDALRLLLRGVIQRPTRATGKPMSSRAAFMLELRKLNTIGRTLLDMNPTINCADIPITQEISRAISIMFESNGTKVDLIFPPYYLAQYSSLAAKVKFYLDFESRYYFANLLELRRCLILSASYNNMVKVHGFDDEQEIVSDPSNYRDPGHIMKSGVYEKILRKTAAGTNILTTESWTDYEARLIRRVMDFEVALDGSPATRSRQSAPRRDRTQLD